MYDEQNPLIGIDQLTEYDGEIKEYIKSHGGEGSSMPTPTAKDKLLISDENLEWTEIDKTDIGGVSEEDKAKWDAKYSKPSDGIPASDFADGVIPTTLPASDVKDWAKADEKPIYTADEVGALSSTTKIPSVPSDIGAMADSVTHLSGDIASSEKGAANGVATLGTDGKVPSSQLPSYVDDVLEYSAKASFPTTGESGKIYVDTSDNKTYRWSGSAYVEISPSVVIGTTTGTAFDGKSGKDHVDNTTVHITAAERTSWDNKQNEITSSNKLSADLISGLPTSLPASDVYEWAKADTKPTYTASEINAVSTNEDSNVSGAITFNGSDNYGIMTSKDNYGSIGSSSKYFYRSYVNNIYGSNIQLKGKTSTSKLAKIENTSNLSGTINLPSQEGTLATEEYVTNKIDELPQSGGTVTSVAVKMNGEIKGTITDSGTIDLGTVASEVVSKTSDGLCPILPDETTTTKYLRQDGTWVVPPDTNTTYSNFVKSGSGAKSGLVPAPSTTAGTTKYLREDGTWVAPPNTTYSSKSAASGGTDVSLVTTGEKYTWNSKTSNTGTVTSVAVKMNGATKGTVTSSGTIDLGSVITTSGGTVSGSLYTGGKTVYNQAKAGWYIGSDGTAHASNTSGASINFHWANSSSTTSKVYESASGNLMLDGVNKAVVELKNDKTVRLRADEYTAVVNYSSNDWRAIRASAFTVMSSKLTKEDIADVNDEEAKKLLDLRPISFNYKENFGGRKGQFGLIAEEALDVIPYCVDVPKDYNEDDFDEEKGINQKLLSIDYSRLVPHLIKMVQIQQEEINNLKERVEQLEK